MNKILFIFSLLFFAQHAYCQSYPGIDETIQYDKYNFSTIDELLKEDQPNKAISKLLIVQILAISKDNLLDLKEVYDRLKKAVPKAGKENEDIQKLFREQHMLFLTTKGATRSLSGKMMSEWMGDYRIRQSFSFDEESLRWPYEHMGTEALKLKNKDIFPLKKVYEAAILADPESLMKIPSALIYDSNETKYKPTLFDVFAQEKVIVGLFTYDSELRKCYWTSTSKFVNQELGEIYRLQAQLEILNKRHKRWDAYAFCVENRINSCEKKEAEKDLLAILSQFQRELSAYPASNRFAFRQASMYAHFGHEYDWRSPSEKDQGFVTAIKIIDRALSKHPESDFTKELQTLRKSITKSSLSFELDGLKHPNSNQLMRVDYRNVTSAYFAIYKVHKNGKFDRTIKNPLQKLDLKLVKEYDLKFEADKSRLKHSKDFLLHDLNETGTFLLVCGPTKERVNQIFKAKEISADSEINYKIYSLTNMVVRSSKDKNGFHLLVNDAKTGKPVKGADVYLAPRNRNSNEMFESQNGSTDENGYFSTKKYNSFNYVIRNGKDSVSSYAWLSNNREHSASVGHVVYTDRKIYRPGQSVFYKALTFIRDYENSTILQGKKIRIEFKDRNSKSLYEREDVCSNFGSSAGSFVLPKSGFPLGNVYIYINDEYANSITVEEYKRPTFEVTFEEPKGRVTLGSPVIIEGKVNAFAGYPLTNTKVEITVSENRYFPFWCIVLEEWRTYDTTIVVQTDNKGVFRFEHKSNKPKDAYGVYYNFDAKVTDLSGEVQTASDYVYLGKTSYSISTELKSKVRTDEAQKVTFNVLNSLGEKQKNVEVQYSLGSKDESTWFTKNRSEAEFKGFTRHDFTKAFPNVRYYKDQKEQFDEVQSGKAISETEFSFGNLQTGNYRLSAFTIDEVGDTIRTKQNFVVWHPKKKRNQHLSHLWAEAETNTPKVDQPVEITYGSSLRKARLLLATYNVDGLVSMEYKKIRRRRKMNFTVSESNKLGLKIYSSIISDGVIHHLTKNLKPVDTSKVLHLKLKSIQEPLRPGTKQSWEVEVSQSGSIVNDAELLATMYDASLDAFRSHNWYTDLIEEKYISVYWPVPNVNSLVSSMYRWGFPQFNDYYRDFHSPRIIGNYGESDGIYIYNKEFLADEFDPVMDLGNVPSAPRKKSLKIRTDKDAETDEIQSNIRENFNETAFFEPQIYVSSDDKYKWSFTLPDALTRWKFMAFAHTKDFKTAYQEQTFEARKELMLETFEPRFWRKGDSLFWVGKVVNLSDKEQTISVNLKIQNLLDESDVSNYFGDFIPQTIVLQPNESKAVEWPIVVSDSCPTLVRFEAEASTDEFADVVRKNMPILEGRERITLAQNFTFSEKGTHDIQIEDVNDVSDDAVVSNYSVTVQTQPLWSTMLSLTKVLEPKNELSESYFNQFFGASLAKKVLDENPSMKQALKAWQAGSDDALSSLLEQNEELKAVILSETPWVLEATNETEKLRRLGQLLNDDYLNKVIGDSWTKLEELQLLDGSWSWVGKEKPSWYITQYFTKGLIELFEYGIDVESPMLDKALVVLDAEHEKRYAKLTAKQKAKGYGLGSMQVEWLYIRSVFATDDTEASKYYSSLLPKKWQNFSFSSQSTIGLIALKKDDRKLVKRIMASFQDKATSKQKLGKYWNGNSNGYGWYQNKIEVQTKMIQFYQGYGDMNESVAAMQKWLLQQKRTQLWDTEKSTVLACFALKDFGKNSEKQIALLSFSDEEAVTISDAKPYDKRTPDTQDLESAKDGAKLTTSSDALVFASAQIVYTDDTENISKTTGDFRVERNYYIIENGEEIEISEERSLEVGDVIKVKLKLVSNRDLDFVYLEDPKAAGWEPMDVLSGYRYKNGFYYQSNRDSKTEIFIENLRKGTYIYAYDLKVTVKGSLQVGSAKATCYYAPSFTANSKGERFVIGK